MKKKLFTLALVAIFAASASVSTFAQNAQEKERIASVDKKDKKNKRDKAVDPFAGLSISDAQRAKLDELNKNTASKRKAEREAAKAQKKERSRDMLKARTESKKKYLEDVKAILTPEQYVAFLENFYLNGQHRGGKDHRFAQAHRGGHHKMIRNGKHDKSPRAERKAQKTEKTQNS